MKIEYRVCDICGQNMDVHDYYRINIDNKSKKAEYKRDWYGKEMCFECKAEIEKLMQSRAKRNEIKFKE